MICRSVHGVLDSLVYRSPWSVRRCVGQFSALWKNGGSDPDAVLCHHRSDGSRDKACSGVWGSVHGKEYFWGRMWGAALKSMGTLRRGCATVPQPSELRFGVVRAVGRGIAVLDAGSTPCKGKGRFWAFCSPFSQWEMQLGPRRWNVADSYTKTWKHFRSANLSLESSIRGLLAKYSVSRSKLRFMRN